MNNRNILLCTAMLATIWEKKRYDNIDLVANFVIIILDDLYGMSSRKPINESDVLQKLDLDFGFENFPIAVLKKILGRLTRKNILKRENGSYFLDKDLSEEKAAFNLSKADSMLAVDIFTSGLYRYLQDNCLSCKNIELQDVGPLFMSFLERNGYSISKDKSHLKVITQDIENPADYYVAKYIAELSDVSDSAVTRAVSKIIDGFYLAKVIYFDADANIQIEGRLKDSTYYFDTGILLQVLGLKTEAENSQGQYLLDNIIQLNGKVACFEHNVREIESIISSYLYHKFVCHLPMRRTLEFFDVQDYSRNDVERFKAFLREKITIKGISIVDVPEYLLSDLENGLEDKYIDEARLTNHLKTNINYRSQDESEQLDNDVKSISAIYRLRKGNNVKNFEKCKAVFVTNNRDLAYYTKDCLKGTYEDMAPPIIDDIDTAAILWLKTYSVNPNYPKMQLIQNAIASLNPTYEFIQEFIRIVEQMVEEGDITSTQAEILKSDYMIKREIMEATEGCASRIEEELPDYKEKYFNSIKENATREAEVIKKEADKQLRTQKHLSDVAHGKHQAAQQYIHDFKQKEKESKDSRRDKIIKIAVSEATKKKECAKKIWSIIKYFILALLIAIAVIFNMLEDMNKYGFLSYIGIALYIVDDTFSRFKFMNKIINKHIERVYDQAYNEVLKREKDINSDLFENV